MNIISQMPEFQVEFWVKEVTRMLDHAERSPQQWIFGYDLGDPGVWLPGSTPGKDGYVDEDRIDRSKIGPRLNLVHDCGVYLISGGEPGLLNTRGDRNFVAYAGGLGREADDEEVVNTVGKDIFIIPFSTTLFRAKLDNAPKARVLTIKFTEERISFGTW